MKRPLVSVVIPSYNHARFIEQALESVFAQTYPELELIVIDDGSRDGSAELIRKTLESAPAKLTTRFFAQTNAGAHAAIGFGLSKARGECLTILNSDDYYHPERIETLVKAAGSSDSELLFTMLEMVSETGERLTGSVREVLWYHQAVSLRHYLPTLGYALIRDNIAVTTGNLFFTRALLDKVGPFREYRYLHDMDFILRALVHTEPKLVSRSLLYYRLHGSNTIRSSKDGFEEEGRRILDDYMKAASAGTLPNRYAPCLAQWPRYFNQFISEQHPFFSESKIGHYLEQSGDPALRPSGGEAGGAVQRLQAFPALTGVCLHVLDRAREPVEPLALLSHDFKDEPGKTGRIGIRHLVQLAPSSANRPDAVALVHEDRILATSKLSQTTERGLECSFVIGTEFGGLDLKRTRFLALEENPTEYASGFAFHAGAAPEMQTRLERTSELQMEPVRLFIGERSYEIRAAGPDGRIDRVRQTKEGDWVLEGSAFDSIAGERPTGVLLFDDESRLRARYESLFKVRQEGPAQRAGFKLVIPSSRLPEQGESIIRAVAVFKRGIALHLGLLERKGRELSRTVRPPYARPEDLERITRTADGWRYDHPAGSREWKIGPWRYGFIDLIDRSPARLAIHGWALEPPTGVLGEAVLITANGKPVALTRLNAERLDLMKAHKLWSPLIAGFLLDLDPAFCKAEIQVFALWPSGIATELPVYGARPAQNHARNTAVRGMRQPEASAGVLGS